MTLALLSPADHEQMLAALVEAGLQHKVSWQQVVAFMDTVEPQEAVETPEQEFERKEGRPPRDNDKGMVAILASKDPNVLQQRWQLYVELMGPEVLKGLSDQTLYSLCEQATTYPESELLDTYCERLMAEKARRREA